MKFWDLKTYLVDDGVLAFSNFFVDMEIVHLFSNVKFKLLLKDLL